MRPKPLIPTYIIPLVSKALSSPRLKLCLSGRHGNESTSSDRVEPSRDLPWQPLW